MANHHSEERISAFDCDILCRAFRTSVAENGVAESGWRAHATLLASELTHLDDIDPAVIDRIIGKDRPSEPEKRKTKTKATPEPGSENDPYDAACFAQKQGLTIRSAQVVISSNGPSRT